MIPGEIVPAHGDIELNAGLPRTTLTVANTGDRPIQVGSHYHFAETNPALPFDRAAARGQRLDIAAGTAVRFEPGQTARGHPGPVSRQPHRATASAATSWERSTDGPHHPPRLCRHVRPDHRRPRAPGRHRPDRRGRARLHHLRRGGEVRRRQGDPRRHGPVAGVAGRGRGRHRHHQRADHRPLGHRQGRRRHHATAASPRIGKAGNPDVQPGVDIIIGPGTEVIAGEGKIVTAGGIDSHIHFICPQQVEEALASGVTTMVGGGTGPATGTTATTCTPGPWHLARMLQAAEGLPVNLAFAGKGNAAPPGGAGGNDPRRRLVPEAARGLGHHAGRHRLLPVGRRPVRRAGDDPHRHAERSRASSRTPSPPSRAAPSTPSTPRAPAAATRPTSSSVAGLPNVLPSSTNPTRPYTVEHARRASRHADGLPSPRPGDPRGRGLRRKPHPPRDHRRRGHPARPRRALDDLVRQPGDGPRRRGDHPHLADRAQDEAAARRAARRRRRHDNARVKRYIAKYTINPAIAQGLAHEVGSIEAASWPIWCCGRRPSSA